MAENNGEVIYRFATRWLPRDEDWEARKCPARVTKKLAVTLTYRFRLSDGRNTSPRRYSMPVRLMAYRIGKSHWTFVSTDLKDMTRVNAEIAESGLSELIAK